MQLTLNIHPITAISFAHSTRLDGTFLQVDVDELRAHLLVDKSLVAVDLEIASPVKAAGRVPFSTSSNRAQRRRVAVRIFPAFSAGRIQPVSARRTCCRAQP
jgi:Glycine/sarcosine/betaine reductase component B subunits